jgi:hypothetical protein
MWQDDRGKGPATEHVNDYQIRLSFYVNFIICLYNFTEITLFLLKLYVVDPDHLDAFKRLGCPRFFKKLDGHHLEVIREFVRNFKEGKTQVGPMEINLTVDLIAEVTEIPRTDELWFKARKMEK